MINFINQETHFAGSVLSECFCDIPGVIPLTQLLCQYYCFCKGVVLSLTKLIECCRLTGVWVVF